MRRAVLLTLLLPAAASARRVDVADVAQLQAAIQTALPGDEIVLQAGTYTIATLSCQASGTAASPIVVRAAAPLAARLRVNALEGFAVTGAFWRFQDLEVTGACAADDDCDHAFHVAGDADGFQLVRSVLVDFNTQVKVDAAQVGPGGAWVTPDDGLIEGCELFDTHARNTQKPVAKLAIDTGDRWTVRANILRDFHKLDGTTTYGAFMKAGGSAGLFERNLVLCERDVLSASVQIGLSFGGGGTAPSACAPAFDAGTACAVEHTGGMLRNNIIANCSDAGIALSRAAQSRVYHNTIIGTTGVDLRFATTTGETRGNVLTALIRLSDGATHATADNLENVSTGVFAAMYLDPLRGDLRIKGDVSMLLGKAPALAAVPDDYCRRVRGTTYDVGALQHALGDCDTRVPALGVSGGGMSGGGPDGGPGGGTGAPGDRPGGGVPPPQSPASCGCRLGAGAPAPSPGWAAALLIGLALLRRARRAGRPTPPRP